MEIFDNIGSRFASWFSNIKQSEQLTFNMSVGAAWSLIGLAFWIFGSLSVTCVLSFFAALMSSYLIVMALFNVVSLFWTAKVKPFQIRQQVKNETLEDEEREADKRRLTKQRFMREISTFPEVMLHSLQHAQDQGRFHGFNGDWHTFIQNGMAVGLNTGYAGHTTTHDVRGIHPLLLDPEVMDLVTEKIIQTTPNGPGYERSFKEQKSQRYTDYVVRKGHQV